MTPTATLLTADEYSRLPDNGRPTELVRGRVVAMNWTTRQGAIADRAACLLRDFLDKRNLGRVVGPIAHVVTEQGPDTLRSPGVAFYSYARVPKGGLPPGQLGVHPELVFDARHPADKWGNTIGKVAEYLQAGVTAVCVFDAEAPAGVVFHADEAPRILRPGDELAFPDLLPGFRVSVGRFFE